MVPVCYCPSLSWSEFVMVRVVHKLRTVSSSGPHTILNILLDSNSTYFGGQFNFTIRHRSRIFRYFHTLIGEKSNTIPTVREQKYVGYPQILTLLFFSVFAKATEVQSGTFSPNINLIVISYYNQSLSDMRGKVAYCSS